MTFLTFDYNTQAQHTIDKLRAKRQSQVVQRSSLTANYRDNFQAMDMSNKIVESFSNRWAFVTSVNLIECTFYTLRSFSPAELVVAKEQLRKAYLL